jgi:hypothetical protein
MRSPSSISTVRPREIPDSARTRYWLRRLYEALWSMDRGCKLKLCRFGAAGAEKPGLIDAEGCLRNLSGHCGDIDPTVFRPQGLIQLAKIDPVSLPVVTETPRFGVPFTGMSKFICIGLNYSDHAAEAGLAVPSEPIIFLKANSALCGPNDDTIKPLGSTRFDWEVELGVVIGSRANNVAETDALSHVAGYCVVNDVSERAFQMQSSQWDKDKGCDTFGPVGPSASSGLWEGVLSMPGRAVWGRLAKAPECSTWQRIVGPPHQTASSATSVVAPARTEDSVDIRTRGSRPREPVPRRGDA